MKSDKLIKILIFSMIMAVIMVIYTIFIELPYVFMLKVGLTGVSQMKDPISLISNVISNNIVFLSLISVFKFACCFTLFLFFSSLLKDLLIPFYLRIYRIFLGIIFFIPSVLIYLLGQASPVEILLIVLPVIIIPKIITFTLSLIFREVRKVEKTVSKLGFNPFSDLQA